MAENPRIEELRRRVQSDPASIAFAALAEEYRRLGRHDEAIATCQAGLQRHPAYLSARVTLGRALVETGDLDSAREQFETVLRSAPENIAATRGLAQIHERLGHSTELDPHLAQLMREHAEKMPPPPVRVAAPPPPPTPADALDLHLPALALSAEPLEPLELTEPLSEPLHDFSFDSLADVPFIASAAAPEVPVVPAPRIPAAPDPAAIAAIARLERFLSAIDVARRA